MGALIDRRRQGCPDRVATCQPMEVVCVCFTLALKGASMESQQKDTSDSPQQPHRIDLKESGFGGLLDFNFTRFITVQLVKVLYIIGLVMVTLSAIGFAFGGFRVGIMNGMVTLILAPLVWIIMVLLLRVYLELVVALFRIAENTTMMVERLPKS